MIQHPLSRTELLVGADGIEKLKNAKVMVFGVGGVGSFAVEALTRAGIGTLILVDDDTVCITNLNRQIHATYNTVNKNKVDVMKERILSINKNCNVITHQVFVTPENLSELIPDDVDYVIDAIDTITAKIALAEYCYQKGINLIASMGTGNKFDPTQFKVADVYDTKVCPLAKVMRYELKRRGVKKLKVVYSEEKPMKPSGEKIIAPETEDSLKDSTKLVKTKRQIPGSISFVPPVAGMILGGEVVQSILGLK
ncbi:tRNA threonylcarbamoyladenosine dehydratase [Clostridium sp.]|uniref:tRNA threonylcarbamoyladenosine dehydratase n=1 Tax=Clostridium sp. TaxID=1506 RepID=UPI00290D8DA9|nr:tRNA threonylcarbamoyladenosine dehydratase [Clostridium sp.]MDU5105234.1 tRNA threonylcarbamoyladenosine dehydratase [Clostridium sp.]